MFENLIKAGALDFTGVHRASLLAGLEAATSVGTRSQEDQAAGQMLLALDFYLGPVLEFAVVGEPEAERTRRVLRAIHGDFRPNKVVALRPASGAVREDWLPLLAARHTPPGDVTLYVGENFACREPVRGADAAEAAIRKL